VKAFFQQQFSSKLTPAQVTFDVLMGIVAPIVCIAIDVFYLGGLATNLPSVSYVAIVVWVFALALWLFLDSHIESLLSGLSAIVLLSGALYAGLVGVVLFYFTCWGLLSGVMAVIDDDIPGLALTAVSLLGFAPFGTAFVFLRNGLRALQRARNGK
jgi:hypothetical protein